MHNHNFYIQTGKPLYEAQKVMIMVHGRGANAQGILSLQDQLEVSDFGIIAPQATNNSWYPQSFLMPKSTNEPWLSSGLSVLKSLIQKLQIEHKLKTEQIYMLGFSQGACLVLEFVAQNAARYGGIFCLSGGLIGPDGTTRNYKGKLEQTPIFLGCSSNDSHIPRHRVEESARVLTMMGANVVSKLYPNMSHTIIDDEITIINKVLTTGGF
jgi:phospholipase/carboxylesterase